MKKITYITGFISSATLATGIALKLLQMTYGSELFMLGFLTLFLGFIPLWVIDRYKVQISKTISVKLRMILGTIAAVVIGLSGLFKVLHLQGAPTLLLLGTVLFAFGFLPFFFFTMYKKSIS